VRGIMIYRRMQIGDWAAFLRVVLSLSCAVFLNMLTGVEVAADTRFQDQLDRAGIAYQVPTVGKAILVNIPSFELIAFDDGTPVLRSRVIVGAPRHRTPRLSTYVSAVRFRPTWRPTPSMIASGAYSDRVWPAGERNPLGLAAVRLEPGLLVYLHDTNRRELFTEENRALSHGCVRVEQWIALVAFVLDMDAATVTRLANGTRTFDEPAPPIPVTLGYYTRFPDAFGRVAEYADIYVLHQASTGSTQAATSTDALACAVGFATD